MGLIKVAGLNMLCRRNESSIFYGRDTLVSRLSTKWADHSTIEVSLHTL